MNCQEYHLPEFESATSYVREALQAILHTILFIRSPGPVAPHDVHCEGFNVTYSRIATDDSTAPNPTIGTPPHHLKSDLDRRVDDAIEMFLRSLAPIGPELLSGRLTVSFLERRGKQKLFGLVNQEERIVWEQWVLRVVVNNTPRPVNDDSASVIERQRIQDTAEGMLKAVMLKIFDYAGSEIDHIPPVMYDFEIGMTKKADDREEVYSRVVNMPSLINLGS